jgi:hypothetical protein
MWDKLLSGRFLLTVACALVFIWATLNRFLEAQAVSAILASVFASYFAQGQSNDNKPKPPTPTATLTGTTTVLFLCLMCVPAFAQTVPDTQTLLQKAGAKSGIVYIWKTNQAVAVNNITLANYKMVDLSAGVARIDGADIAVSVDIAKLGLPIANVPVLSLLNYGNVGAAWIKESSDKPQFGMYASASWKF